MEQYNFKVIVEKKDNLSIGDSLKADELTKYWQERKNMIKENDNTYFRLATDNADFGSSGVFAHKLSLHTDLFNKIELFDLNANCSSRFL